jgi:hypothetical protein
VAKTREQTNQDIEVLQHKVPVKPKILKNKLPTREFNAQGD